MDSTSLWRTAEFSFQSTKKTRDPYHEVDAVAAFIGPGGVEIMRPAFWDGERTWKVRFAPTLAGTWRYSLSSNDPSDAGLNGQSGTFECIDSDELLPIFQRGFLRQGKQGWHLAYADETPFFWLGDTHWRFTFESWNQANKPGWASQFRGMVDKRVEQGFTVYQTNLMMFDWASTESPYWVGGKPFTELNTRYFQNTVDPRMAYIADSGLVNAVGLGWYDLIDTDVAGVKRFARYIVARYGSYPVVWTLGGEVAGYDPDLRQGRVDGWRAVALTIRAADGYNHPRTAHSTAERPITPYYRDEEWLTLSLNQHGHGDFDMHTNHYRNFLAAQPGSPLVEGESMYEGLLSVEFAGRRYVTDSMVRHVAYRAIQSGCCGYTYGAQGCWNGAWDRDSLATMWGDLPWYEGIDLPGASQMGYLRRFYETVGWADLRPMRDIFVSDDVLNSTIYVPDVTADRDLNTVVIFFGDNYRKHGGEDAVTGLGPQQYTLEWFDPRNGSFTVVAENEQPVDGKLSVPAKPDSRDWIFVIRAKTGINIHSGSRSSGESGPV